MPGLTTSISAQEILSEIEILKSADVLDRVDRIRNVTAHARQMLRNKLVDHKQYIARRGEDMPEVNDWVWPGPQAQ